MNYSQLEINGFKPTHEQVDILDCVAGSVTFGRMKIGAFAGAGKSTSLKLTAKAFPKKKFLYIVFNKSMQIEAQEGFKGLNNITVRTSHSLAFQGTNASSRFGDRLKSRLSYHDIKGALGIGSEYVGGFPPSRAVAAVIGVINNFCYSSERSFKPSMLPSEFVKEAQLSKLLDRSGSKDAKALAKYACIQATKIWNDFILDDEKSFPITHDAYLKIWQLEGAKGLGNYDIIMLDEAQDANPAILKAISDQESQSIYVGDKHQSIYGWRGSTNAMESVEGKEMFLTQSFRFGENIAGAANMILDLKRQFLGEQFPRIKGFENASPGQGGHAILCRTNAQVINNLLDRSDYGLIGDFSEVTGLLYDLNHLRDGNLKEIKDKEIKLYSSLDELKIITEEMSDPSGKTLIKLHDRFQNNLGGLSKMLKDRSEPGRYKNVITTAHKSKGLEWSNVSLSDDFQSLYKPEEDGVKLFLESASDIEELNLIYVGATRAQSTLFSSDILVKTRDIVRGSLRVTNRSDFERKLFEGAQEDLSNPLTL
ncbi:MAG: ATP-dependent helicase [Methyloprofundus sp.]|nr:ATP-dependent helicase [Methyloprofundus sp.]